MILLYTEHNYLKTDRCIASQTHVNVVANLKITKINQQKHMQSHTQIFIYNNTILHYTVSQTTHRMSNFRTENAILQFTILWNIEIKASDNLWDLCCAYGLYNAIVLSPKQLHPLT